MKFIKIFYYIESLIRKKNLKIQEEQTEIFSKNNLNYLEGKNKLENVLKKIDLRKYKMSSEHLKIFSAISLKNNVKDILEIGTYDGFNCLILKKLFPHAEIDTLDLPENDEEFLRLYNRNNDSNKIEINENRSKNLGKTKQINFKEKNSLNLIFEDKRYDLIWIDGFHGAPTVISDIINSIRLIKSGGIILIDDVCFHGEPFSPYQSNATYKTLLSLKKANLIQYNLFYKRLDIKYNSNKYDQKYIALVKKC
tara:strand:- start:3100 stop:3855 length:756 start_codon:yes stop_codon:yes gene_type:complete